MSGHSKWANIKRHKGKIDAQRGKIFTKLAREIIVASRMGGGEPDANFRLKIAIQKARAANMPNDNIQRAIQRGIGGGEGTNYEEMVYEGYGPGGVAVLMDIMTDNRNRTAGEIRHIFSRNGGNLGETGCVAWMFEKKGLLSLNKEKTTKDEDEILMLALEAGAEDVKSEGDTYEIITAPEDYQQVQEALSSAGVVCEEAVVTMMPQNTVELREPEQARLMLRLMELLEEHDDVQEVYANFDIADELMEQME